MPQQEGGGLRIEDPASAPDPRGVGPSLQQQPEQAELSSIGGAPDQWSAVDTRFGAHFEEQPHGLFVPSVNGMMDRRYGKEIAGGIVCVDQIGHFLEQRRNPVRIAEKTGAEDVVHGSPVPKNPGGFEFVPAAGGAVRSQHEIARARHRKVDVHSSVQQHGRYGSAAPQGGFNQENRAMPRVAQNGWIFVEGSVEFLQLTPSRQSGRLSVSLLPVASQLPPVFRGVILVDEAVSEGSEGRKNFIEEPHLPDVVAQGGGHVHQPPLRGFPGDVDMSVSAFHSPIGMITGVIPFTAHPFFHEGLLLQAFGSQRPGEHGTQFGVILDPIVQTVDDPPDNGAATDPGKQGRIGSQVGGEAAAVGKGRPHAGGLRYTASGRHDDNLKVGSTCLFPPSAHRSGEKAWEARRNLKLTLS